MPNEKYFYSAQVRAFSTVSKPTFDSVTPSGTYCLS